MTLEEFNSKVNKGNIQDKYILTKNRNLLNYMTNEQIIELYKMGHIEAREFCKNVTIEELLRSSIDVKTKIDILTAKKKYYLYNQTASSIIWEMLENGSFSIEDVKALEKSGYINIMTIVNQYTKSAERKIASELGEIPQISAEKLLEYFSPDVVLDAFEGNGNNNSALISTIERLYESNGLNICDEIAKALEIKYKDDRELLVKRAEELFDKKVFRIDVFTRLGFSKSEILDYCEKKANSSELLIELFNNELISQDDIYEIFGDNFDNAVFELISNGMSSKVIAGLCSTAQLIEYSRTSIDEDGKEIEPKLSVQNLFEIRDDIETGLEDGGNKKKNKGESTLLDLYVNNQLTYSELYNLAEAGVISIEVANEINEKYNFMKDWETLKEIGVTGNPIEGLLDNDEHESNDNNGIHYGKGTVGIDEECIVDLYVELGATEYLEIDAKQCPVFKDYIIIPIMDKKVAYLEGTEGRTYIVPLKIVFEQINNPNGELDLIGNASSRNGFNSKKQHVRSANHTKNWGKKIIEKTADLPSVPMSIEEAKQIIENNKSTIKAIENSYYQRKYAKYNRNNDEE